MHYMLAQLVPMIISTPFTHQSDISYCLVPFSNSTKCLFDDVRFIPLAIVCASVGLQVLHLLGHVSKALMGRGRIPPESESNVAVQFPSLGLREKLKNHISYYGGSTIFGFMLARLLGSAMLLQLSKVTLQRTCDFVSLVKCPEAFLTITFMYSTLLGLISVLSTTWSTSITRHNTVILLSALGMYLYRDIWPLATYDTEPADSEEGSILIAKISILMFTAVVVPLFIPRRYIPVDLKDPMAVPNPEQTASIFSLITYTFLNQVIFLGYKVPHLRLDQLPPLPDYDSAKYQTMIAFPHLDVFSGARPRALYLRLLWVFSDAFMVQLFSVFFLSLAKFISPIAIYKILNYLETGGEGQSVKPWVWIICLFCGPMLRSICLHWCSFVGTRAAVLAEALLTELVFEHSLRIRFKAEAASIGESRVSTNVSSRAESPLGSTNSKNASGSTAAAESEQNPTSESSSRKSSPSTSIFTLKGSSGKVKVKGKTITPAPKEEFKKRSEGNLVGKINNLITSDLNNILGAREFLWFIVGVPVNIALCLAFLYQLLGWSTFVGFGILVALLPVPGYIAKKIQQAQAQKMKATDARIQAVSEAITIIRMMKLFGWENKMSERLKEKRKEELTYIWRIKLLNCANGMVGFIFPTLTMVASYGVYTIVMKKDLTPSTIFPSMAVFWMLRTQVYQIMEQGVILLQGKVSFDRMDDFLQNTELLDSFVGKSNSDLPLAVSLSEEPSNSDIGFRNASFSWYSDEEDSGTETSSSRVYRLRIDGDLLFKRNAINLIIGPTGSGKTSVLMALLGEMHFISSPDSWFNLPRKGGVAYATQESWVQNDTIRNNILFGSEYDEERYQRVIEQCALEQDLELLDAGDATEVGERGLTLSGGQKARVTLARAIYSPADILLLDDVLAALDVHTSTWIVDRCFRGDLIKDRTVLLVTHNVALASPIADFIVSIGTDGRIKSQGNQLSVALSRDPKLAAEVKYEKEVAVIGEEVIDAAPAKKPMNGKLIVAEEIAEGHVTWKSFKLLLSSLGGDHPIIFYSTVITALILYEGTASFQVWYIGYWGSQYERNPGSEVAVYLYLSGYMGIIFLFWGFFAISYLCSMRGSIRASQVINTRLIDSILGSTLRWLDETPVGRIITRCTQDIRAVDGPIPHSLHLFADYVFAMLAKLGSIVLFTPIFIWPGLTVGLIVLLLGNMYMKAQLSVKRETSNARAPMISHFSAALHGLVSIRAYGAQERFKEESLARLNYYIQADRMSWDLNRWFGVRVDFLGACFTTALAAYLIYGPRVGTSNTGFSLNMALEFTTLVLYLVRLYNNLEVEANSLERIQGYIDIEHEPKATEAGKPPAAWPSSGDLRVEKLSARYSRTGPEILHDISFTIAAGERVGVVGRTGSGKSSLVLALLRCILTEGEVYFDGLPTSKINLDALRTSITIIPQTPELLSGTLRENLDPFGQHDDAVLNSALQDAGLFSLQEDAGEASLTLDIRIASGGGNLSVGQRQIIALARAIIRGSKLLMLDEATSAIDYKTDAVIQNTLRTRLPKDVTVITVAHRLQTIMDSDKIMVLDNGRIAEFGSPADLLKIEKGTLRALVDESGDKEKLYELAERL